MYALIIFVVALMVRLIHAWQMQGTPFFDVLMGDANGYDHWAQRIAAGDWIGSEVFYQAPLYPYFLGVIYSLFGRDLLIVRIIQAIIGSASCLLLGLAAARFFTARAGLIAGLALALWAPAIFFDGLLQKSVLDVFFVSAALYLISRIVVRRGEGRSNPSHNGLPPSKDGGYLLLGIVLGLLALTRENAVIFIGVVLVWMVAAVPRTEVRNPHVRRAAALAVAYFIAGLALVLLPVVARNYAVDGGLYLTTSQFGPNFYIGNNPDADGTYASIRFGRGSPEFERRDATEAAEASVGRTLSPSEVSSFWTGRALGYIAAQPLDWLRLMGRKVLLLINRDEMLDTESQESHAEYSLPLRALGWFGHFGVLVPLAVLGLIVTWPDRRRLWILHALTITYALSVVMFYVFARYRYPLVPLLLLFVVPGLIQLRRALTSWAAIGAVLIVGLIANVPLLSPELMQTITENNLGTALQERQRYDEAIRHHQRAIELEPGYAPAYNNLGVALRAAGRIDEAIASYRKAIERQPEFPGAQFNLANALLARGDTSASVAQFQQALDKAPQSVEAQNNLGIALAQKGDAAAAIAAFRAALTIDERSAIAHRNLGNMLIDSGSRADGIAHLERAIALAPSEGDALYDLGTVLLESRDFAGAARRFRGAIAIRPDWPEAHNNLGIALASLGQIPPALAHFERAVELKPDFAEARANRDQARNALKR